MKRRQSTGPPNSTGKAQGREKQIYPLGVLSDQSFNRGYIFLTNHSEAADMLALDAICMTHDYFAPSELNCGVR